MALGSGSRKVVGSQSCGHRSQFWLCDLGEVTNALGALVTSSEPRANEFTFEGLGGGFTERYL